MSKAGSKRVNLGPSAFATQVDVTVGAAAAEIAPARTDRDAIIIGNQSSTVAIRVGDANVAANRGIRVKEGATATLFTTSAVYAISEGANVTADVNETHFD